MAVGDHAGQWFLVNASPDLAAQIEACPDLHPRPNPPRNSPIAGVLLSDANLDHLLGLFSLREGAPTTLYAPAGVARAADRRLGLTRVLGAFCGAVWREPSLEFQALAPAGLDGGLEYRMIPLSGGPPLYAQGDPAEGIHQVAYHFRDDHSQRQLLVAPDVGEIGGPLLEALQTSDAILLDGTFWSEDELAQVRGAARSASQMGHATIRDSTLELLRSLPATRKIYIHINNTNPILAPGSPERRAVEAAGVQVGEDGVAFEL